jgi:hypothetical protein
MTHARTACGASGPAKPAPRHVPDSATHQTTIVKGKKQ